MFSASSHSLLLSVDAEPRNSCGTMQHGLSCCFTPHNLGGAGGGPGGAGHDVDCGCCSS